MAAGSSPRPWGEVDRRIHAANMQGYRQAVYLARTVVGSTDPALGAQIDAAGTAVLDVYDALTKFRHLPAGASENLAAVALTGNLVGVSLTLAGALKSTGPSEGEILIGELRRLSKQVEYLRIEMHHRFDGIHEHLDAVYANMLNGFRVLQQGDARLFDSVIRGFENSHAQMTELGRVQLDTQAIVVRELERISDELTDLNLALHGCLRPRTAGGNLNQTEFKRCRDGFAGLHRGLPRRQLALPEAITTRDRWLTARPDRTMSWGLEKFKSLLRTTGRDGVDRADHGLPNTVVGPEAWFGVMELYEGFVAQYPEFASQDVLVTGPSEFSESMSLWKSDLILYGKEVREELRAYQDDSRPTVFSKLFEEAWNRDRLEEILLRSSGDPVEMLWNCMNSAAHTDCHKLASARSSAHVRDALLRNEEFRRLERNFANAGAYLRHWIVLAFRDAIGRSEALTALAAGWATVPDVGRMVSELDVGLASWPDFMDEIDHRMEQLKELLRSTDVKAAVSGEFEHEILTGFSYPSLGDGPSEDGAW